MTKMVKCKTLGKKCEGDEAMRLFPVEEILWVF